MRNIPLLAVIAALMAAPVPAQDAADHEARDPGGVLTVTGTGTSQVVPNMATINLGVQTLAPTAAGALEANNAPTARLIALFKDAGVAAEDIATNSLSVYPRFDRRQNDGEPPAITGYQVSNTLTVRIRALAGLGDLLDRAVDAGANSVSQISFGNDDLTEAQDAARVAAVRDAARKARIMAEAAGVVLGDIVSISEGQRPQSYQPRFATRAASAEAVPVEAGSQGHSISVTVIWEIGAP